MAAFSFKMNNLVRVCVSLLIITKFAYSTEEDGALSMNDVRSFTQQIWLKMAGVKNDLKQITRDSMTLNWQSATDVSDTVSVMDNTLDGMNDSVTSFGERAWKLFEQSMDNGVEGVTLCYNLATFEFPDDPVDDLTWRNNWSIALTKDVKCLMQYRKLAYILLRKTRGLRGGAPEILAQSLLLQNMLLVEHFRQVVDGIRYGLWRLKYVYNSRKYD